MKMIKISLLCVMIILVMGASKCNQKKAEKTYNNKPLYSLKVGEEFSYFMSLNSCCIPCTRVPDILDLTGSNVEVPYPEGCDGCDEILAFNLKAIKPGRDSLFINAVPASEDCEHTEYRFGVLVEVKE